MQTFLPYEDYDRSAGALDRLRLGKQRLEVRQLLTVGARLEGLAPPERYPELWARGGGGSVGWAHHPALAAWRGHWTSLGMYGLAVCAEWARRGYKDSQAPIIISLLGVLEPCTQAPPPWVGRPGVHRAYRSCLVRKDPDRYRPLFGEAHPDDPPPLTLITKLMEAA